MNRRYIVSGLFWLVVSIFVCVKSIELGIGAFATPGSGFLFFWSSLILGALSVVLVVKGLFEKKEAKPLLDLWKGGNWGNALLATLALFLYVFFLSPLGFIITAFVFMIFLFGIGKLRPWITVASAFIAVALSYIIFHFLLQIHFPRGILRW